MMSELSTGQMFRGNGAVAVEEDPPSGAPSAAAAASIATVGTPAPPARCGAMIGAHSPHAECSRCKETGVDPMTDYLPCVRCNGAAMVLVNETAKQPA